MFVRTKLGVYLIVAAVLLLMALPTAAASVAPVVYDDWAAGSAEAECGRIGYSFGYKIEGNDTSYNGTYNVGPGSITVYNAAGSTFSWSSTFGIDAVIAKASTGANVYFYNESLGDTELVAYDSKGTSHITFCWDYELTASKTASGTYDRTYSWAITKSVTPASHTGVAGDSFTSNYSVFVDQTVVDSKFFVSGTITVNNPSPVVVSFSVSDSLGGSVSCLTNTLSPGGSTTCSYNIGVGSATPGTNFATITSNTAGVGGASASANYGFVANPPIGYPTVNVTDSLQGGLGSASADYTFTYPRYPDCPTDTSLYTNGVYSYSVPNTATIVETQQSSSANVTVNCTLPALVPSKTAAGSYDRTVTWTLDKSVAPSSHSGVAGQTAGTSTWTVVADKTEVSNNYKVTGTISVYNPAAIPQTFSVADVLDDGTFVTVDCPSNTVAAGATVACTYTASPVDGSATVNTATVTAAGNPAQTATATVSFTEKLIGYDSGTLSDPRFGYSDTISGDTTVPFEEDFVCPAEASVYVNGTYSFVETNTATLNGNINLTDSAEVTVTCTLLALVPSKTAVGSYDRTVTWTLDKSVAPSSHSGFAGELAGTSTWTVVADKTEVSDNYEVTGTISVYNPAAIAQTFSVADVLNDGAPVTVTCPSDTVAAGETVECTYSASPDDASATLNTATVTAAGNPAQTATAPVSFTETLIGYDSGTLSDPRFGYSENISGDKTKTFPEDFVCPAEASVYVNGTYSVTVTNTATLNGNINLSASATVDVTCEAGFVDLLKTTNGVVNPSFNWQFELYLGPDGFGTTPIGSGSTLGDADGVLQFGDPALIPGKTYTVCELGVPAGYSSFWQLNGVTVLPYNPNADAVPSEDVGNRCYDFSVAVGETAHFVVDNTTPGGDPRTPGYWKNWNTCSGGGQAANAARQGGYANGFWLLDDVLNPAVGGGIVWDDILSDSFLYPITSCTQAVSILDQRDTSNGKKMASDAAYTLAMHLLAAQLNFGAGACTTQGVLDTALAAETLLDSINFKGSGSYLRPRDAKYSQALSLAAYLDSYNNGAFCGSLNP